MTVKITRVLKELLDKSGAGSEFLIKEFAAWKAGDEYGSFYFGKDAPYETPTVDGDKNTLMHVHLVPLVDEDELRQWKKRFRTRSRKTSDRVLVYVSHKRHGHLLIFILDEPDAHKIARMRTLEHRLLMESFAEIAAEFMDSGEVLERTESDEE